jgi:hypothetical protein
VMKHLRGLGVFRQCGRSDVAQRALCAPRSIWRSQVSGVEKKAASGELAAFCY